MDQKKSRLAVLKGDLQNKKQKLQELDRQLAELDRSLAANETEIKNCTRDKEEHKRQLNRKEQELSSAYNRISNSIYLNAAVTGGYKGSVASAQSLSNTGHNAAADHLDETNPEIRGINDDIQRLEGVITGFTKRIRELEQKKEEMKQDKRAKSQEKSSVNSYITQLEREITALERSIAQDEKASPSVESASASPCNKNAKQK